MLSKYAIAERDQVGKTELLSEIQPRPGRRRDRNAADHADLVGMQVASSSA
jgi:hypothetical protein